MKITTSLVKKIVVNDLKEERLDPISIYLEDYGVGAGKLIITCFDKSWTYYWGSMGEGNLTDFILSCDNWYLSKKLNPSVPADLNDEDGLEDEAKKRIIEKRKHDEISKNEARDLYDNCDSLLLNKDCDSERYSELMYDIFGDEWYDCLPKKPNPEYTYFHRILDVVKKALKETRNPNSSKDFKEALDNIKNQ
jgi:hypothetical protein